MSTENISWNENKCEISESLIVFNVRLLNENPRLYQETIIYFKIALEVKKIYIYNIYLFLNKWSLKINISMYFTLN